MEQYTLEEAKALLRKQECDAHGHDMETMVNGAGDPLSMRCTLCGRKWKLEEVL